MTFIPNPAFETEFKRELSVRAAMRAAAGVIEAGAKAIAPGSQGKDIEAGEDEEGAYVTYRNSIGHIIEFGSVNSPPYAPIRRAVTSAGLGLQETKR